MERETSTAPTTSPVSAPAIGYGRVQVDRDLAAGRQAGDSAITAVEGGEHLGPEERRRAGVVLAGVVGFARRQQQAAQHVERIDDRPVQGALVGARAPGCPAIVGLDCISRRFVDRRIRRRVGQRATCRRGAATAGMAMEAESTSRRPLRSDHPDPRVDAAAEALRVCASASADRSLPASAEAMMRALLYHGAFLRVEQLPLVGVEVQEAGQRQEQEEQVEGHEPIRTAASWLTAIPAGSRGRRRSRCRRNRGMADDSLARMRFTWLSAALSLGQPSSGKAARINCSRVRTTPGASARLLSMRNSVTVSGTARPPQHGQVALLVELERARRQARRTRSAQGRVGRLGTRLRRAARTRAISSRMPKGLHT